MMLETFGLVVLVLVGAVLVYFSFMTRYIDADPLMMSFFGLVDMLFLIVTSTPTFNKYLGSPDFGWWNFLVYGLPFIAMAIGYGLEKHRTCAFMKGFDNASGR